VVAAVPNGNLLARVDKTIKPGCEFDTLLVPAYIDLDGDPRVVLFPQSVFLGTGGGFVYFSIDAPSGQLRLDECAEAFLPSELSGEPSVKPIFADLTANYLGDGPPAKMHSISFYLDRDSDPERGTFRAVTIEFEGGDGISLDPFSFSGIRIGTVPDLGVTMGEREDVEVIRIPPGR
jgi:hypothetical protein